MSLPEVAGMASAMSMTRSLYRLLQVAEANDLVETRLLEKEVLLLFLNTVVTVTVTLPAVVAVGRGFGPLKSVCSSLTYNLKLS